MTRSSPAVAVIVEIVTSVAESAPARATAQNRILTVLGERLDATLTLWTHVDLRTADVEVASPHATGQAKVLIRHLMRRTLATDPAVAAVAAGELRPYSAQAFLGRQGWQESESFQLAHELFGISQIACMPLYGNADEATAIILGKDGADFADEDLALLESVQPAVIALDTMLRRSSSLPQARSAVAPTLTRRESDVLVLLARGYKAATIARLLGCSPRTVHRHLAHVYGKLDVGDRLMAVSRARELGLLDGEASSVT